MTKAIHAIDETPVSSFGAGPRRDERDGGFPNAEIARILAEITRSRAFHRRLPEFDNDANAPLVNALNALLSEVEEQDRTLRQRLDQLVDARDDAQTANLMLRRVKEDLRSRSVQLDAALRKAAAGSSAKSQFLANMSHEIRTPMNGILGMAELLRRTSLDDRQRQQVNTIVHSGRALLQIINDILDFSKVESGKFDLDPKPFDLSMCLADIVELLRPTAHGKSLAIALDMPPGLPRQFVGDAGRIRQIVMNLAGNAVKFTERGSVTLKLTGRADGDVMALQIDVIDTGIGIPAEKLGEVFDKFSQVDQTCTRRHEGTGLGLSISQLLARRMNGDITVASEIGRGSIFSFMLKLPVHVEARRDGQRRADLTGARIVLAGESGDVDAAAEALSALGCIVVTNNFVSNLSAAARGADAVALFSVSTAEPFAERLAAVRACEALCKSPIVVHVTTGAPGDAKLVFDGGADAYLCGAFDAELLSKALLRVLSASSPSSEVGRPQLVTRYTLAEDPAENPVGGSPEDVASTRNANRVLVVDDSLVNQEVAREFLEELGCEVSIAANGQEALQESAETRFDLIMMDCQMPVLDGFAATREMRSRTGAATPSDVPIVALTANAFASDREKCLASGMSDFLSKPFMPSDFDAVVNKWLTASVNASGRAPAIQFTPVDATL